MYLHTEESWGEFFEEVALRKLITIFGNKSLLTILMIFDKLKYYYQLINFNADFP